MPLATRTSDDALILSPSEPRLDAQAAVPFRDAFLKASEGGSGPVVLDLAAVTFMDSSGLGAIVACFKALGRARPLVVAGASPSVAKLFAMTRIDQVLKLTPGVDEALAAVRA
jgi:anti-sigma B factor antagonist